MRLASRPRKAELQVALAEAQSGDIIQLQNWLEAYQTGATLPRESEAELLIAPATNSLTPSAATISDASICSVPAATEFAATEPTSNESTPESPASEADSILSWDRLLPHARQRLLATRTDPVHAESPEDERARNATQR